jgi:hypothetical protein
MSDETNTNPENNTNDTIEVPPQVVYGISIFQMEDDRPAVHVTGEPDLGQLQRLLGAALANLNADIVAQKVVQHLDHRDRQTKIVRPGQ